MQNLKSRYNQNGLPCEDIFFIRKIKPNGLRKDLDLFESPLPTRHVATPAVMSSQKRPQATYTTSHWGSRSGFIFRGDTHLAAGFKYHALTKRITGESSYRFAMCQDHGGRIHTADEMQAKFIEWAEREAEWYKALFGEDVQHTKDWLQGFFLQLADQVEALGSGSSSSFSSSDLRVKISPMATTEAFAGYLKDQGCSGEYVKAQDVFVRSRYPMFFSDLCGEDDFECWPVKGYLPKQRNRRSGSGFSYAEVNECLLMPTRDDVIGVYVNPGSVAEALEMWSEYCAFTGVTLPLYTYTQEAGLKHAIDSINDPKLKFYHYLFANRKELSNEAKIKEISEEHIDELWQWSLESGRDDIIKALSQHASLELNHQAVHDGCPELISACKGGCLWVVNELISQGANVNIKNKDGSTALIWAARYGYCEVVKALLGVDGINVNAQDGSNNTALMWAARYGYCEVVKALLEKRADVNTDNNAKDTALILAARYGHSEVVDALLGVDGINVNAQDGSNNTALILALKSRYISYAVVRLLLGVDGINVNAQDGFNNTALIFALARGHLCVVKALIDKGANANAQNRGGNTALMLAAGRGQLGVVKALIDIGANVNAVNDDKNSVLMLAAGRGQLGMVNALIGKGAEVNAKNNDGNTALILAAQNGHLEVVNALIGNGAEVNADNNDKNSALILAASDGHCKVVKALIDKGANVDAQNKNGDTARRCAEQRGHLDTCALLEKSAQLITAASMGHLDQVSALLGEGASVNAKNNDGNTALILAAQNGHLEVVNALLSEARVERDYGALLEKCKSNDCVDVIKKHQRDDFLAHLEKQTTRMNDQQKTLFDVIKKQLEKCKCPVSLEVMVNPVVIGPGGQSIEKWSYEKLPDPKTNPVNRQPITLCEENRVLKSVIDGYWQVLQGLDSALSPSASLQSGGMFATSPGSEPSAGEPAAKRRRVVGGGA